MYISQSTHCKSIVPSNPAGCLRKEKLKDPLKSKNKILRIQKKVSNFISSETDLYTRKRIPHPYTDYPPTYLPKLNHGPPNRTSSAITRSKPVTIKIPLPPHITRTLRHAARNLHIVQPQPVTTALPTQDIIISRPRDAGGHRAPNIGHDDPGDLDAV